MLLKDKEKNEEKQSKNKKKKHLVALNDLLKKMNLVFMIVNKVVNYF